MKDNIFKRLSLERTLSCVYFCIIGIFTEAPQSICLFQDHTLFNYLFGLSKMVRSKYGKYHEKGINDYLITRLLCSCDFTQSDNLRIISNLKSISILRFGRISCVIKICLDYEIKVKWHELNKTKTNVTFI